MDDVSLEAMTSCMEIQIFLNTEREEQKLLELWMRDYWPIVIKDLTKICGNKFLILETLLRIIDYLSLFKE